jgi:hypothetical protein
LALDATTLGDRFCVLAISVVYRGCAIPVAWLVLPAGEKRAWRREWLRMLRLLHRAVPPNYTVLVLADRGLYARWLFRRVVRLGWHPFLRISRRGTFRPANQAKFWPLVAFAPKVGSAWAGEGTAFKTEDCHLDCTLLARWEEGHADPWLILTDLDPSGCDVAWYGLRIWIERGFKSIKRGGWQWQSTRMTEPERAERLWLVVALSTLWLVSIGGEAEADSPESACEALDHALPSQHRKRRATRLRQVGVFQQGLICLVLAMFNHESLPLGRFRPEPWPRSQPLPNLATLDLPLASQNPTPQETYP